MFEMDALNSIEIKILDEIKKQHILVRRIIKVNIVSVVIGLAGIVLTLIK